MRALDVAKYIITKCNNDNQSISNLQLQKILYYVQYEFLTQKDRPLFRDDFRAWKFGPVLQEVYYTYSHMGAFKIGDKYDDYDEILENMDDDSIELLNETIESKCEVNAWDLVDNTHKKGKAWDLVFDDGNGFGNVISKEEIKENAF